jgi:hypothetical protein
MYRIGRELAAGGELTGTIESTVYSDQRVNSCGSPVRFPILYILLILSKLPLIRLKQKRGPLNIRFFDRIYRIGRELAAGGVLTGTIGSTGYSDQRVHRCRSPVMFPHPVHPVNPVNPVKTPPSFILIRKRVF